MFIGFLEAEAPRPVDSRRENVVRLSALSNHRVDHSSEAGRIMSVKNSSDTIGNRTCDLPACNSVPQTTALPRVSHICTYLLISISLHPIVL